MASYLYNVYAMDREKVTVAIVEVGGDKASLSRKHTRQIEGWEFYDITDDVSIMYGEKILAIVGDKKSVNSVKSKLEEKLGVGLKLASK